MGTRIAGDIVAAIAARIALRPAESYALRRSGAQSAVGRAKKASIRIGERNTIRSTSVF